MDKNSVRKRRHSKINKRMGWKRRRNKEVKIYLTIFLICIFIAGAITFITGKVPTLIKKTVDKQIARRAGEVLGKQLEGVEGLEGMDSKKIDDLKKKYGGMIDKYRK